MGETVGWRWLAGVMAIFTGFLWILGTLTIPETYAPLLLRKRAAKLSRETGKIYQSKVEVGKPKPSLTKSFKTALSRPWVLLFLEPIVLLLSVYMVCTPFLVLLLALWAVPNMMILYEFEVKAY